MKFLFSSFYFLISNAVLMATAFAQAKVDNAPGTFDLNRYNPLKTTSITDLINRVINYLIIYIGPPILTLMILYGAFQILTAGGDPEKFKTGRKTILYAVIGYAILLVAGGVGFLIKELLGAK